MNRARVFSACLGLGVGLVFYLACRSDHTLSNRLVSFLCGTTAYRELKSELRQWLPVPLVLRGCLPSALWCFIATSLSGEWRLRVGGGRIVPLAWAGPVINAGWEIIQWLGWTDGQGDWLDVAAGSIGWMAAQAVFLRSAQPVEISNLWNWRVGVVMTGFACMGLADVWK